MIHLCAFADEISPDLKTQIAVCVANGVTHVELRGVDNVNVLDFDATLRGRVRDVFGAAGLSVACIGSPIGKVAVDAPWAGQFDRFKRAVDLAEYFGAPLLRVFSYYPAGGEGAIAPHREEIIARFVAKTDYLAGRPVTLVHENEKGIFGDTGARCLDLMHAVNSPRLQTAFDPANFVQVGEKPAAVWPLLKPYVTHLHIKDAELATGRVVPAGLGDGDLAFILLDAYESGYAGCFSLEPHLQVAGHSHGETGPDLFRTAADALKTLCRRNNIPLGV